MLPASPAVHPCILKLFCVRRIFLPVYLNIFNLVSQNRAVQSRVEQGFIVVYFICNKHQRQRGNRKKVHLENTCTVLVHTFPQLKYSTTTAFRPMCNPVRTTYLPNYVLGHVGAYQITDKGKLRAKK
jgi:hypothetical protein